MSDFFFSLPFFIHVLDLIGTIIFAFTGAFKAIENKYDLFGIIVLSSITGFFGGVMRDVLLGKIPPYAFVDPFYIIMTVLTGILTFYIYPLLKYKDLFIKLDAIGLGVFSIIGSGIAFNLFGLNYIIMALSGIITAIGGGIIRDILVNETPLIFVKELYVTSSFIGITIFFMLLYIGMDYNISSLIGIGIIILFRFISMKYGWNLPRRK
ncbi:MAG: hypothetical protein DA328_00580 [Nitrososphaeraceae archaeon]|nr:hypothetical protein [Nitrososphaeraceae archaeon]